MSLSAKGNSVAVSQLLYAFPIFIYVYRQPSLFLLYKFANMHFGKIQFGKIQLGKTQFGKIQFGKIQLARAGLVT